MQKRLIRLNELLLKVGFSRSSIYLMIKRGDFPPPIQFGPRLMGWEESTIDGWIKSKISPSRMDEPETVLQRK